MQIISKTYFQKRNQLNIPLAVNTPSGSITPSNSSELDLLCVKVEKDVLLNALGLALWKEKEALTGTLSGRWKNLIEGEEYDGKKWNGLQYDYSLIAYRVYEEFTTNTNIRLASIGAEKPNAENSENVTPNYLIATANQQFIKEYQGIQTPYINGIFTDWYNCDIERNLYSYLIDKKDVFTEWDYNKFKLYETKNSFGL